jgi:retron-type reverse transcriptase
VGKGKKLILWAFNGDAIPQAFLNSILVLIPKPGKKNELRPIALLEVIYKLVLTIINTRLNTQICFHDAIHGFRAGRGTSTAIIEAPNYGCNRLKLCTKSS